MVRERKVGSGWETGASGPMRNRCVLWLVMQGIVWCLDFENVSTGDTGRCFSSVVHCSSITAGGSRRTAVSLCHFDEIVPRTVKESS